MEAKYRKSNVAGFHSYVIYIMHILGSRKCVLFQFDIYHIYFIDNGTIKTNVLWELFCCVIYMNLQLQLKKKLTHSL